MSDVFTREQERWLGGRLWAELTSTDSKGGCGDRNGPGRNAWWDLPLNPKRKPSTTVAVQCGRCCGAGAIASFSIKYSGKCFACNGSGVRYISRAKYEKQKALRKAAEL